jgi:hypothetical protein
MKDLCSRLNDIIRKQQLKIKKLKAEILVLKGNEKSEESIKFRTFERFNESGYDIDNYSC